MQNDVNRRVAVITGASSGIGKEAAMALAAQGWRIMALGRDPARAGAAEAEIRAASSGAGVEMVVADLALLADAARAARQIAAATTRIDVLINNAGGMAKQKVVTPEGNEQNFSGNHLGPFLLTLRLLPLLRATAQTAPPGSVRIINTSSDASEMLPGLDWNDLQGLREFNAGRSYCGTKLANVMFARGLAQRLAGTGIVAHAVHPGTIDSNFFSHADESTQARLKVLDKISPREGAEGLIWLATAEEAGHSNGGYFYQRSPHRPNPFAEDPSNVDRLWEASEKLVAASGV